MLVPSGAGRDLRWLSNRVSRLRTISGLPARSGATRAAKQHPSGTALATLLRKATLRVGGYAFGGALRAVHIPKTERGGSVPNKFAPNLHPCQGIASRLAIARGICARFPAFGGRRPHSLRGTMPRTIYRRTGARLASRGLRLRLRLFPRTPASAPLRARLRRGGYSRSNHSPLRGDVFRTQPRTMTGRGAARAVVCGAAGL